MLGFVLNLDPFSISNIRSEVELGYKQQFWLHLIIYFIIFFNIILKFNLIQ